ncbi:MAG: DUF4249 family protein [bacterium]
MKERYLVFILIISFMIGCQDNVVENDLGYVEKFIVRSKLEAGKPISVYFGKTLPPNQPFDISKAFVSDVNARIVYKGRDYPLIHESNGNYKTKNDLAASNGETYELFAEWNGKSAYAITQVPFTTTFQGAKVIPDTTQPGDTTYYFEGFLTPRPGAVYGATWSIISNDNTFTEEDTVIVNLLREKDKDLKGFLLLQTRNISNELLSKYRDFLFIRIHAFDEQFYNYFITQDANNASTNIFSQAGVNLRWNVKGENALGMFIGKSDYIIRVSY